MGFNIAFTNVLPAYFYAIGSAICLITGLFFKDNLHFNEKIPITHFEISLSIV